LITRKQFEEYQIRAAEMCREAGIVLTKDESDNIEVVDEGLGNVEGTGLQIVTYINTERVCAKEIIMFPFQTCPEHAHPAVGDYVGKEETFRCRRGTVYLYLPGEKTEKPAAIPPRGTEMHYTVWREIALKPGEQYTVLPGTLHWFQAGAEGAIISEFSTKSLDETDIFTNPHICRTTEITD